ncbi:MAG: Na+/H+ antiporter subunit E [Defluviitaleaceae bacterium]|nr:Na+/H+ antiporter subunit E [Defluviitaleaceae bacterium]
MKIHIGRHVFALSVFIYVWIMFTENISWQSILIGLVVGGVTLVFMQRLLPIQKIVDVKFRRLFLFPFYLIGQIYISGFHMIRIILKGSEIGIISIGTSVKSETLKTILGASITLTPGSILLETIGDEMTILWIRCKNTPDDPMVANEKLKDSLEQYLLRAQVGDVAK